MTRKRIPLLTALALALALAPALTSSFAQAEERAMTNRDWWPESLNLQPLRQHGAESDPMGSDFDYAEAFKTLDLAAVKKDIEALMTTSQPW